MVKKFDAANGATGIVMDVNTGGIGHGLLSQLRSEQLQHHL